MFQTGFFSSLKDKNYFNNTLITLLESKEVHLDQILLDENLLSELYMQNEQLLS